MSLLSPFFNNWKEAFEKLEASVCCAFCASTLKYPSTLLTTCCHVFCESCINAALDRAPYCPLCKKPASLQHSSVVQVPNVYRIVELLSKIRKTEIFQSLVTSKVDTDTVVETKKDTKTNNNNNNEPFIVKNNKRPRALGKGYNDNIEQPTKKSSKVTTRSTSHMEPQNIQLVTSVNNKEEMEYSVISILPTGLDAKQYMFLKRVIAKLGRAYLATSFETKVTHLVTGHYKVEEKVKRTMKLCIGMVSNCKILSFEWLIHCNMANDWISTFDFEMRATCRRKPGLVFSHELFYLGEYTGQIPSSYELEQLITLGGGQIIKEWSSCPRRNVQWIISGNVDQLEMSKKYPNVTISTLYPEQLLDRICLR